MGVWNCLSDLALCIQYRQKRPSVILFPTKELISFKCKRGRIYNNMETYSWRYFCFIDRRYCLREISYSSFRISSGSYWPWHMDKKLHIRIDLKINIKSSALETDTNVYQLVLNFVIFGITGTKWPMSSWIRAYNRESAQYVPLLQNE